MKKRMKKSRPLKKPAWSRPGRPPFLLAGEDGELHRGPVEDMARVLGLSAVEAPWTQEWMVDEGWLEPVGIHPEGIVYQVLTHAEWASKCPAGAARLRARELKWRGTKGRVGGARSTELPENKPPTTQNARMIELASVKGLSKKNKSPCSQGDRRARTRA